MAASKYSGGCQCGAVRFEVSTDLDNVVTCNCSRCGRLGSILAFAPAADFTLLSGADAMTEYQFGRKVIHHMFCATCGIQSFARGATPDGSPMVAVNARCLDDVDPATLSPRPFDGRSL